MDVVDQGINNGIDVLLRRFKSRILYFQHAGRNGGYWLDKIHYLEKILYRSTVIDDNWGVNIDQSDW